MLLEKKKKKAMSATYTRLVTGELLSPVKATQAGEEVSLGKIFSFHISSYPNNPF